MELAAAVRRQAVRQLTSPTPNSRRLLPVLYPGVFPNLAALVKSGKPRADLEAILLTGIPSGIIPGFTNFTGPVLADMLRLNTSIPPTPASKQSIYGLLGGDAAGFPNGRRVTDDIVAIELRAIAGVTYPLIDKTYKPDAAARLAHRRADPGRHRHPHAQPVPLPRGSLRRLPPPGPVPVLLTASACTPRRDLGSSCPRRGARHFGCSSYRCSNKGSAA